MAALPFPTYGVSELYLYPFFQTREAYQKATGNEAPPYDASRPIKSWFDPKAADSPRRRITYDHVISYAANGMPEVGTDGKPYTEAMILDKDIAATVNIPFKAPGVPDQPTTGQEIPVPLRALAANEELYIQFGGSVAVRNKDLWEKQIDSGSGGFTSFDRALLQAIADKLGVGLEASKSN